MENECLLIFFAHQKSSLTTFKLEMLCVIKSVTKLVCTHPSMASKINLTLTKVNTQHTLENPAYFNRSNYFFFFSTNTIIIILDDDIVILISRNILSSQNAQIKYLHNFDAQYICGNFACVKFTLDFFLYVQPYDVDHEWRVSEKLFSLNYTLKTIIHYDSRMLQVWKPVTLI